MYFDDGPALKTFDEDSCEDVPSAGSPVADALNGLSDEISHAGALIAELSKRLRPVLREQGEKESGERLTAVKGGASPHVNALRGFTERVHDIQSAVSSLLNRLEV